MKTNQRPGFSVLLVLSGLLAVSFSEVVQARPETIRPGESYYSEDSVTRGLVRDLGEEGNYEEVYQLYSYYEAIYDATERVVVFVEYRRGERVRREEYSYGADGELSTRTVTRPGHAPEVTRAPPPGEGTGPD